MSLDNIDDRSTHLSVKYAQMDASNLTFSQDSFDLVFSFNAFEHFLRPDLVLAEAVRVVKEGGYIYLCFDPLYYSPWGLQAYYVITFPYCQCLFTEIMLQDFLKTKGLRQLDEQLNHWSVEQYRYLWKDYNSQLKSVFYQEKLNPFYLDIIKKYPSCFKSEKQSFDNFIISGIEVLFKKVK